ncbi:MAG: UbiA family prenyltransferase [Chitinispirillaceae bacterium]|nr:UbiA family prenyltransferase [Chitinispirillaceae bacterium]
MNVIAKLLDLLMSTRPLVLVPVWSFCSLGFICAVFFSKENFIDLREVWRFINPFVYIEIIIFSLSVASVYVMNQLADIEADKKNGGLPLIASGIVSEKEAKWIIFFTAIIPFIFFAVSKDFVLLVAVVLTLFIGYIYSFRPFRFSGRPCLDFLSNAFGYGVIAFGVGYTLAGGEVFDKKFLFASLPYFF